MLGKKIRGRLEFESPSHLPCRGRELGIPRFWLFTAWGGGGMARCGLAPGARSCEMWDFQAGTQSPHIDPNAQPGSYRVRLWEICSRRRVRGCHLSLWDARGMGERFWPRRFDSLDADIALGSATSLTSYPASTRGKHTSRTAFPLPETTAIGAAEPPRRRFPALRSVGNSEGRAIQCLCTDKHPL